MSSTHPLLDITKDIMQVGSDIERYDWQQIQNNQSTDSLATASRYSLTTTARDAIYDVSNLALETEFVCQTSADANLTESHFQACCASAFQAFDSIRLLFDDTQVAQILKPGKADIMRSAFEYSLIHGQTIGYNEGLWFDTAGDQADTTTVSPKSATVADAEHTSIIQPFNYKNVAGVVTTSADTFAIYPNPNYNEGFAERYKRCLAGQSVNVMLPLKRIFPVLESMRAIRGVKIEVQLVRNTVMDEVMYGKEAGAKLVIKRLDLWVPRIQPSLSALQKFEQALQSNEVVKLHYHHMEFFRRQNIPASSQSDTFTVSTELQRPVFALVAFSLTERDKVHNLNSLQFDVDKMKTLRMFINNTQAPEVEYDLIDRSSSKLRLARVIQDCQQLAGKKASFERDSSAVLDYNRWKNVYPIFPFDLSKIPMSSLSGKSPAEVKVQWTCDTWAGPYDCNVLLYSERALDLHLKSGRMLLRQA